MTFAYRTRNTPSPIRRTPSKVPPLKPPRIPIRDITWANFPSFFHPSALSFVLFCQRILRHDSIPFVSKHRQIVVGVAAVGALALAVGIFLFPRTSDPPVNYAERFRWIDENRNNLSSWLANEPRTKEQIVKKVGPPINDQSQTCWIWFPADVEWEQGRSVSARDVLTDGYFVLFERERSIGGLRSIAANYELIMGTLPNARHERKTETAEQGGAGDR